MADEFEVYLSSTKADLQAERELVLKVLRDEQHWRVKESYSASNNPVLASCLKDVESAKVYVCIIGACYGTLAAQSADHPDWSYTHHEFEHALKRDKPIYLFIKTGGFDLLDDSQAAVKAFKAYASAERRPANFKSTEELRAELNKCRSEMDASLHKLGGTGSAPVLDDPSFNQLRRQLLEDKAFVALPAALPTRWAHIQSYVGRLLVADQEAGTSLDGVAMLAQLWHEEASPALVDGAPQASQLLNLLTRLVERCNEQKWGGRAPATAGLNPRRQTVMVVMKLLFALSVHEACWDVQRWAPHVDPVSFMNKSLMGAVFSLISGRGFHLELASQTEGVSEPLRNDWAIDLDAVETGITINRRNSLEDQLCKRFTYWPRLPRAADGSLSDVDRKALAARIQNRCEIDSRRLLVAECVTDGQSADLDLLRAAHGYTGAAVARKLAPSDRLREDEFLIEDALTQCLQALTEIP